MKKKLVMILMAVMVASATLGGCGQKGAETGTSVSAEEEDVQISYKELMKATDYKVQKYVKLNDYMNMTVELSQDYSITDEQIQEYIEYLLSMYPEYETTDKTTVENGDIVNIDYVGKVDGVEFQGGSAQGTDLELGSGSFIGANGDYQGFEDQIVGHNKGEQFDITVQFPDTYMNTEMAGKVAVFTITLNGIYTVDVPKLTDKWVKENSVEATTVKEYKKEIKEKIENQQMYQNLLNALVDQIEVKKDLPKDKVKEQKEAIINQYESTAEYYQMELGDYLTQYMGMTEDQFKEKAQTVAENTVRNQMAVELLCEKKNLEPTDKEYEIGLKQYAALAGYRTDQIAEYKEKNGKENIEQSIMQEKAAKYLQKSCVQVEQEDETTNENAKDTQNSTTENKDQNTDQSSDQSSTDNAQE